MAGTLQHGGNNAREHCRSIFGLRRSVSRKLKYQAKGITNSGLNWQTVNSRRSCSTNYSTRGSLCSSPALFASPSLNSLARIHRENHHDTLFRSKLPSSSRGGVHSSLKIDVSIGRSACFVIENSKRKRKEIGFVSFDLSSIASKTSNCRAGCQTRVASVSGCESPSRLSRRV